MKPSDRHLVVTGADGFTGRHLVREAMARDWTVTALVRDDGSTPDLPPEIEIVAWNLASSGPAAPLLAGATVCHLAAYVPPDLEDPDHAEACLRLNAVGTLDLLRTCQESGARRFIYFSAGNLYARAGDRPARESSPLYPARRAPYYLTSKLAGEVFVENFRHTTGLSSASLRISSIYGPGMRRGFVLKAARRLRRGERVELSDSGRFAVDLVLVEDVASIAMIAAERDVVGPINVGSGHRSNLLEVGTRLAEILGADPGLVVPLPEEPTAAPGFASLDISRAREQLDFRPTPLADGLRRFVAALP